MRTFTGILPSLVLSSLIFSGSVARAQVPAASGTVLTIAGNGVYDFAGDGGPATNAALKDPSALAIGPDGTLYFTDASNFRIRAIAPATGIITTIAGTGDGGDGGDGGPATSATFYTSGYLALDRARQALYFADVDNERVRRVSLTNGLISNFAGVGIFNPFPPGQNGDGGPATGAYFRGFLNGGIAVDGAGNVYIAEGCRIRKVDIATGLINTIVGRSDPNNLFVDLCQSTGEGVPASAATLNYPSRVAADSAGNVFVLETGGPQTPRVRRIAAGTGIITTVAGGGNSIPGTGPATNMNLGGVWDLAVSDSGTLFIANQTRVLKVDLATGQLSPYAGDGTADFSGDGGPALSARFNLLSGGGLTLAPGGGLVISDGANQRIRYVVPDSITLTNDNQQTAFHLPRVRALSGDFTIASNPNLTNVSAGSLTNVGGSVTVVGNTATTGVDLGSLVSVDGALDVSGNTTTTFIDLSSLTAVSGAVSVNGNTATTGVDLGSLVSVDGALDVSGNTSATGIDLGALTTVAGNVTIEANAPNATVDLSSLCSFGCDTNPVVMTLSDGTFIVTNCLTLCSNATLTGNANLDGSVANDGTISPGSSPGRLNFTRNLVLGNASRLKMELGGSAPGQFDFINVNSNGTLGGTLAVSLIANFPGVMTNGAGFTLLTAGSPLTGAFANVASGGTLTTTDGYARFTVLYAGGNTLRLTNLVIVDTDSDGLPDWWEDRFALSKTSAADAALDADGDGASNLNEFLAGTNPTNAASVFHVVSLQRETDSVRLTWSTVGGKSYVVQTNGVLSGAFTDLSPLITVPGAGESVTNFVDSGAATNASVRYYRVRLGQ